jgi:hypothetical protein
MKQTIIFMLVILLLATNAWSADVKLDWDSVSGATGYKIQMSLDNGVTWQTAVDAKLVKPYTYLGVPEDKLVVFRVASYNAVGEAWNRYAFAAYDHRQRLSEPTALGVR